MSASDSAGGCAALSIADLEMSAELPGGLELASLPCLDLNALLISDPPATFFVRVAGDSMNGIGIEPGDILVVDKGLAPQHGHIVLAIVNNAFTVKRLYRRGDALRLEAENSDYPDIIFSTGDELMVWGVVTGCVKQFRRAAGR